jgi:predicted RNA-binding protein with EMAP domain
MEKISVQPSKQKGWANERAQFEQSQDDIGRIAQTLTESEQPQVQRIARKLVDYTGEIEQIASLQRELEKLEYAKISRLLDAERNQEIKAALDELNEILQDDEDAAEALLMMQEMETRHLLGILGIALR